MHPWIWLTTGQNASGVQAVAAATGLVGLFLYTVYTRKMMRQQEKTARAELYPVFAVRETQVGSGFLDFQIANVGRGAAVNIESWWQPVTHVFKLDDFIPEPGHADVDRDFHGAMGSGEEIEVIKSGNTVPRCICCIQCVDVRGARHQLALVVTFLAAGNHTVEARMYQPMDGESLYRRVKGHVQGWLRRRKAPASAPAQ